jgi:hypothetical protein
MDKGLSVDECAVYGVWIDIIYRLSRRKCSGWILTVAGFAGDCGLNDREF